jgi:hypothetical protein
MFNYKFSISSVCILSFFLFLSTSSISAQGAKKRHIERKSIKFNIGELALADIPISSRLGISYEFLLDRNYGIMIGMAYLGYPVSMWGSDSLSRAWRSSFLQKGYNFDLSFRHYFDDADDNSYYISTYFSTSRLWLDNPNLPNVLVLKKDKIALVLGYQKKWRSVYFDVSAGIGVKSKNWKTHLQQINTPTGVGQPLRPDYKTSIGWNIEFNKSNISLAMPVQFLAGFRF